MKKILGQISVVTRLSAGLALLTMTILLTAGTLGLMPNRFSAITEGRAEMSKAVAVQLSVVIQQDSAQALEKAVKLIKQRNPSLLSLAVRHADGTLLAETSNHSKYWKKELLEEKDTPLMQVPLSQNNELWGNIELCFQPLEQSGFFGFLGSVNLQLPLFVALIGFLAYILFLRRSLRNLDPSAVIPDRVKVILDTLSEGVLILDNSERIIFANKPFIESTGLPETGLQGTKASEIDWQRADTTKKYPEYPWVEAVATGATLKSVPLTLKSAISKEMRTFVINSTPIRSTDGQTRGALATFDDVSWIEEKNTKLQKTLSLLEESRSKIQHQNEELKNLAMHDPLTGCLNRRAFFERFESEWEGSQRYKYPLGCVMVDVDHFKTINDTHGHAVGDQVLQQLSSILRDTARKSDYVCRYGGEEFCVLLSHTDIDKTHEAAERFRKKIEESPFSNISVTVSLGISANELGAANPQEMLDQADQALYAAKHGGRNQTARWDQMPEGLEVEKPQLEAEPQTNKASEETDNVHIPYHAVSALMSALEYRNTDTAAHSRKVADLCVITARGLMSVRDNFVLEVAALLHDIGKLGVPDAILLKPSPLTEEEWKVMETHDQMGVEIINSGFGSTELTNIVRNSHAWYGGNPRHPELPKGLDIPVRSRIILIADAFDAMTSDRVYRKAVSQQEAFAELRRCAPSQFDPELLERFIEAISAHDEHRSTTPLSESQAKALKIGIEIEKLSCALATKDINSLADMAHRLALTADTFGLPRITEVANELSQFAKPGCDTVKLLEYTNSLFDLCRLSNLTTPDKNKKHDPAKT